MLWLPLQIFFRMLIGWIAENHYRIIFHSFQIRNGKLQLLVLPDEGTSISRIHKQAVGCIECRLGVTEFIAWLPFNETWKGYCAHFCLSVCLTVCVFVCKPDCRWTNHPILMKFVEIVYSRNGKSPTFWIWTCNLSVTTPSL